MNGESRDLLAEWIKLGREVLERYYPDASGGTYVIELPDGRAVQLVVTRPSSSAPSPGSKP